MVSVREGQPQSGATLADDGFEWRASASPWRWLILSALGVSPSACGGLTELDPAASSGPKLGGSAGFAGSVEPVLSKEEATSQGGSAGTGRLPRPSVGGAGGAPPEAVTYPSACENATALGGGWLRCDNGLLHRVALGECASSLPRPDPLTLPAGPWLDPDAGASSLACREDTDCDAAPYGHCEWSDLQVPGSYCSYGCVVDEDCGAGQVCLCGDPVGQCVAARCATDEECGAGQLCADYVSSPGCGGMAFACQTADDACAAQSDCTGYESCTLEAYGEGERRVCSGPTCAIGRPFLVSGAERLAMPLARADWYPSTALARAPEASLEPSLRAELARGWTEQGLMEHASVAAFARFSLQLMSLGAPADLLLRASAAMQDEVRHARDCFALARRYAGSDVGPGPLPVHGALDDFDLRSVVLSTIAEGCIGETVAALEAAEALAHCEEPQARAALERISAEETRHAELAWQFVAWALANGPASLKLEVKLAFESAHLCSSESPPPQISAEARRLLRYGQMSADLRQALRRRVLAEVIAPCARALLEGGRRAPGPIGNACELA